MIYLGFGHPLPWYLAALGAVLIVVLPFLITAYIREALGPHASDTTTEVSHDVPQPHHDTAVR